MSSIDIYSFIELNGEVDYPQMRVEEISRPGLDGVAFKEMGVKAMPTPLYGFAVAANASTADTLLAGYASLVGSLVTIVLHGVTYNDMLVLEMHPQDRRAAWSSGLIWIVESTWLVCYAGD